MSEVITQEKSQNSNVVIAIVAFVVLVIVGLGGYAVLKNISDQNSKSAVTQIQKQEEKSKAVIEVIDQNNYLKKYDVEFAQNDTAFTVMKNLDKNSEDFEFKYSESSYGAFVTEINGYIADSAKNQFWKMIINEEDAAVGISDYKMQKNDVLKWEIDTF